MIWLFCFQCSTTSFKSCWPWEINKWFLLKNNIFQESHLDYHHVHDANVSDTSIFPELGPGTFGSKRMLSMLRKSFTSRHLCTGPHFWGSGSPWPWRGCGGTRPCRDSAPWPWRPPCPWRARAGLSWSRWRLLWSSCHNLGVWNEWKESNDAQIGNRNNHGVRNFTTFRTHYHWTYHNLYIKIVLDHIQAFSHWQTRFLLESWSVLSPHLGSINIGWRLSIGLGLWRIIIKIHLHKYKSRH